MPKLTKWQQKIIDDEKDLSLTELLIRTISQNDRDGYYTDRGWWEFDYLVTKLFKRLGISEITAQDIV